MHRWLKSAILCGLGTAMFAGMPAAAGTLAYWRFEGDGVTTPTDGTFLVDTNGRTTVTTDGLLAVDSSGNGNTLYTWDNNATGHQYRPNTPASIIPQTGATNSFSIQNNGANPASFTWSRESSPTSDIETVKPLAWTIEASIFNTSTANNAHRAFVGRDGNGVSTATTYSSSGINGTVTTSGGNSNRSPLYFKAFNHTLGIEFATEDGNFYQLYDTTAMLVNQWYNVAVVSDGVTVKLYRDSIDNNGYQLVASMAFQGTDNRLAYDDVGSNTAGDTQWGWTVGRGRFGTNDAQNQNHTDRWLGYIDEVRISDSALDTNQFLFSVPEPASLALMGLGGLCMVARRRTR